MGELVTGFEDIGDAVLRSQVDVICTGRDFDVLAALLDVESGSHGSRAITVVRVPCFILPELELISGSDLDIECSMPVPVGFHGNILRPVVSADCPDQRPIAGIRETFMGMRNRGCTLLGNSHRGILDTGNGDGPCPFFLFLVRVHRHGQGGLSGAGSLLHMNPRLGGRRLPFAVRDDIDHFDRCVIRLEFKGCRTYGQGVLHGRFLFRTAGKSDKQRCNKGQNGDELPDHGARVLDWQAGVRSGAPARKNYLVRVSVPLFRSSLAV